MSSLRCETREARRVSAEAVPRMSVATLLLAAAASLAVPASAVVYVIPTDESMVDRSPVIVFGEVLGAGPGPDDRMPTTDYPFAVDEVLKGALPGSTIMVRQPGGVAPDGMAMRIMGLPMLEVGDRVLLFLRQEESGAHQIVEYSLGMFWEVDVGERVRLLREPSLQAGAATHGGASAVESAGANLPRDAARFRHWIADRAAGFERSADYFETEPAAGPVAVQSPYRLIRTGANCLHDLMPLRWQDFDLGNSLAMTVASGGQVGVPGGGAAELQAAMTAWNGDAESHVSLTIAGSGTPTEANTRSGSSQYWILFEDPFDTIGGSFDRDRGGILTVTRTWWRCGGQVPPHETLGDPPVEALQIQYAQIITQDGYGENYVALSQSPAKAHEEIMARELGHVLGIGHSCGGSVYPCPEQGEIFEALMRAYPHNDGRGARLSGDDLEALRYLYPIGAGGGAPLTASCSGVTCLLQGERFRVKAWYSRDGGSNQGAGAIAAALGGSAGLFGTDSGNPELLVRIVNRCSSTGYWEIHAGAASDDDFGIAVRDTRTNELKWFRVRDGEPVADNGAFSCAAGDAGTVPAGPAMESGSGCSGVTCLLQSNRFRVKSWFSREGGRSQAAGAIAVDVGKSAGLFAFAGGDPELLVRIVNRCSTNGYWAVHAGAASDLGGFRVAIRNTSTNALRWFRSVGGASVSDVEAFPCEADDFPAPDLVISSVSVSDDTPDAGDTFTLSATVLNDGDGSSNSTTLRYYRSSSAAISSSDTEVGSSSVVALSASSTSAASIALPAPTSIGTYWYGACVDPVAGESSTSNNCSEGVQVAVAGPPDLVVSSASASDDSLSPGQSFTLSAVVRNRGDRRSAWTTLRWFRSADSGIDASDTAVGTDPVRALSASRTSSESVELTAPASVGTYWYGGCVDPVAGESSTTNNCSDGVRVTVSSSGPPSAPDLVVSLSVEISGSDLDHRATVTNQGGAPSAATKVNIVFADDSETFPNQVIGGTAGLLDVPVLRPSGMQSFSVVSCCAPRHGEAMYRAACVDPVVGESRTDNNCSSKLTITNP